MADFTNNKPNGSVYPENATQSSLERLEPLIGYDEIVHRHLFGLPLISQMKDPLTGKAIVMTPDIVKDIIDGAISQVEEDCHIDIFPVQRAEKHPFDRPAYESFGFINLKHRPVTSVEKVSVTPQNNMDVYVLPLDWLETTYAARGQINIIPLTQAFTQGGMVPQNPTGGQVFLNIMGNRSWIPQFWQVTYTSGFKDGMLPRVINDLVGTVAAQEILSMLAVTYQRAQSHSLGIDGLSQSISTPGPQIFQQRQQELDAKRKRLIGKVRAKFGTKLFSSQV